MKWTYRREANPDVPGLSGFVVHERDKGIVAEIFTRPYAPVIVDESYARLIASAPEMLRYLISASHALRSFQHGNSSAEFAKDTADDLDRLIASVKGKS